MVGLKAKDYSLEASDFLGRKSIGSQLNEKNQPYSSINSFSQFKNNSVASSQNFQDKKPHRKNFINSNKKSIQKMEVKKPHSTLKIPLEERVIKKTTKKYFHPITGKTVIKEV